MLKIRSFFSRFLPLLSVIISLMAVIICGCKGKQTADDRWVDSVLKECDSIPEDTLVYEIEEQVVSKTVDEYFNDFFYTFTHNKQFQAERTIFPLIVTNELGEHVLEVKDEDDFKHYFSTGSSDCYVMLINNLSRLEEDPASTAENVDLHIVDPEETVIKKFGCSRQEGQWTLCRAEEIPVDSHPYGRFLKFYQSFATDTVFQQKHVAQSFNVSIPDEDDFGNIVEGTVEAEQFSSFAPVLPQGKLLFVDYDQAILSSNKIIMVKCGLGSGMMDIMTFEEEDGDWKLTGIEQ